MPPQKKEKNKKKKQKNKEKKNKIEKYSFSICPTSIRPKNKVIQDNACA